MSDRHLRSKLGFLPPPKHYKFYWITNSIKLPNYQIMNHYSPTYVTSHFCTYEGGVFYLKCHECPQKIIAIIIIVTVIIIIIITIIHISYIYHTYIIHISYIYIYIYDDWHDSWQWQVKGRWARWKESNWQDTPGIGSNSFSSIFRSNKIWI